MESAPQTWDWSNVETTEPYPGIRRQQLSGVGGTLVRYVYHPGSVFPVHAHRDPQITTVHSGEIEFVVDGEAMLLRAGQVAMIPGDAPHGARVVGEVVVVTDNYFPSADRAPLIEQRGS